MSYARYPQWYSLIVLVGGYALVGCSATVSQKACETNDECAVFGSGSVCGANGYCTSPGSDGSTNGNADGGTQKLLNGASSSIVRTVGIADISGSLDDLGGGMRDGVMAALAAYNEANPTERQFVHEMRDDVYDPEESKKLLDDVTKDQRNGEGRYAFAIVGSMGSPTSEAMLPMINERQIPFFGTYSGATHLRRTPPDRVVWNTRASYRLEGETITKYLLNRDPDPIPKENIFAFAQSPLTITTDGKADLSREAADNATSKALDGYGNSGYVGIVDALQEAGLSQTQIPLASYRATSTTTEIAEEYFFKWLGGIAGRIAGPQLTGSELHVGISMIPVASGATPFVIGVIDGALKLANGQKPDQLSQADWESIPEARKTEMRTVEIVIASISPAGDQFATNLKTASAQRIYCKNNRFPIIVSQVVPFPQGSSSGAINFRADLEAYDTNITPGFVNFEGWVAGKVWIEAVTRTEGQLTVDSLIETLESGDFSVDLGIGAPIAFPADSHDGSNAVYGSKLNAQCEYEDFSLID
jgi:hypothetical protein